MRPVISTRISPVTTLVRGGRPPTPLGHEKPVPCMEQMQRTGSRIDSGSGGGDVTISVQSTHTYYKQEVTSSIQVTRMYMQTELISKKVSHDQFAPLGLHWSNKANANR